MCAKLLVKNWRRSFEYYAQGLDKGNNREKKICPDWHLLVFASLATNLLKLNVDGSYHGNTNLTSTCRIIRNNIGHFINDEIVPMRFEMVKVLGTLNPVYWVWVSFPSSIPTKCLECCYTYLLRSQMFTKHPFPII